MPSRPPGAPAAYFATTAAHASGEAVGQQVADMLSFVTDQGRGCVCSFRVAVRAGHRRAFPGGQHRYGEAAVADRRIRFRRLPRPRADHQHPPPSQSAAPGGSAGSLRRQRHDPAHIGEASGGSGTANAFSRNDISV